MDRTKTRAEGGRDGGSEAEMEGVTQGSKERGGYLLRGRERWRVGETKQSERERDEDQCREGNGDTVDIEEKM